MLLSATAAFADDWPQFRGPERTGVSAEKGLARSWPEAGPPVLWTVDVGDGFGAPSVRDGEVYLLDRIEDRKDILRCLDLATGRQLWSYEYDAPGMLQYNGSRQAPTVDERFVYALGPFGDLHAIDRKTHQPAWTHHLVRDFRDPAIDNEPGTTRAEKLLRTQLPTWGMTQSPLLYEDLVIVAPQTQKVGVVGYERATGKIRWSSGYIGRNWFSHVSPTLMRLDGVDQVIMLAQPSDPEKSPANAPPAIISSIDPRNGAILWTMQTPRPYKIPITVPAQAGPDRFFMTGGYGLGALMVQAKREDGQWRPRFVWQSRVCAAHIQSPIVHEGHIYSQSLREHGATAQGLVCLDLDGNLKWQAEARNGFQSGPFLIAGDLLFILHGRTGELRLAEANPAEYRELAKARVLDAEGGTVWSPMALSNGRLLVRDRHQLRCLDVRRTP